MHVSAHATRHVVSLAGYVVPYIHTCNIDMNTHTLHMYTHATRHIECRARYVLPCIYTGDID